MNANLKLTVKLLGLTLILIVLSGLASSLIPGTGDAGPESPATPPVGLLLVIFFVQVLVLAIPILKSRWHGWRLTLTIFILYFGTVTFMSQVESLVYLGDKMPEGFVAGLMAMGLLVAAVFSPLAVAMLGKWKPAPGAAPSAPKELDLGAGGWKLFAAGLVFLALYYLFGYYVAWQDPQLRAYYGGSDPGSFFAQMENVVRAAPWMPVLQFVRGLLWVGLGVLVIRSMRGPWWQAGLATALLFAMPSLYLLFSNPVMPDFPRLTHLVETLPYQFLFGWFLAWLLVSPPAAVRSAALED